MTTDVESFKQAMDWRYPYTPPKAARRASPPGRGWTPFEEEALLGLMARQYHAGDPLTLATMLNSSLNDCDYRSDISTPAIQKKVKEILRDRPAFADLLIRHNAGRVTRHLKMAFVRALKYSGHEGEDWRSRAKTCQEQIGHGAVNSWGNGDALPRTEVDEVIGWGYDSINVCMLPDGGWGSPQGATEPVVGVEMADMGWGATNEQVGTQAPTIDASELGWGTGTSELLPSGLSDQFDNGDGGDGWGGGVDQMVISSSAANTQADDMWDGASSDETSLGQVQTDKPFNGYRSHLNSPAAEHCITNLPVPANKNLNLSTTTKSSEDDFNELFGPAASPINQERCAWIASINNNNIAAPSPPAGRVSTSRDLSSSDTLVVDDGATAVRSPLAWTSTFEAPVADVQAEQSLVGWGGEY